MSAAVCRQRSAVMCRRPRPRWLQRRCHYASCCRCCSRQLDVPLDQLVLRLPRPGHRHRTQVRLRQTAVRCSCRPELHAAGRGVQRVDTGGSSRDVHDYLLQCRRRYRRPGRLRKPGHVRHGEFQTIMLFYNNNFNSPQYGSQTLQRKRINLNTQAATLTQFHSDKV